MNTKKALIIGSGIGGLSIACRLAKIGYEVTVIEKNNRAGGRCNIIEENGFNFDTGPTILMMKEIIETAFTDIGENLEEFIDLVRIDPSYQIIFPDDGNLILTQDKNELKEQMEKLEQGSFQALQGYIKEGQINYNILIENLFNKKFDSFLDLLSLKNLYYLFRLKVWKK